ncbi:MAG: ferredoxin [Alphaproteobacteria bacterium]|nr:ferredoxin [Alphaproteobacteria bacterium]
MYVCLCNGYRDSELRELARRGFSDAEDAFLALGDGPCCGGCLDFAQTIMDTERAQPGCPDAGEGVEDIEDKAA